MTTTEYVTLVTDQQTEIQRLRRKARAHKRGLKEQARAIEVWKKRYYEAANWLNAMREDLD